MRGAIQMKMIGWELIQNNNIICIFSRKSNYFSSTSTIIDVNENNEKCSFLEQNLLVVAWCW